MNIGMPNCNFCNMQCCPNWEPLKPKEFVPPELKFTLGMILKLRGLTQKKLAEMSGVTPAAISMIIKKKRKPQAETLKKIADALEVTMDSIMF